jgi:hypothetical protein
MTLLLTELHVREAPTTPMIIFAADRRISVGPQHHAQRKKIFPIPHRNAGIGYFGLAQVGSTPMSDWLTTYMRGNGPTQLLGDFATNLADRLNSSVPEAHRRDHVSGFHIAGFAPNGRMEFWYVRNTTDDYQCTGRYSAREEFQNRDANNLQPGTAQIYRNGDIRSHVRLWTVLDQALVPLLAESDFRPLRTDDDYADWVRFKLQIIAYLYKKWCRNSIIGTPIDVLSLRA